MLIEYYCHTIHPDGYREYGSEATSGIIEINNNKSKQAKELDSKIEIFSIAENQTEIIVRLDKDTVWLKKDQIAELFERDRSVINRHISNIFKEQELDKKVVYAKFAQTTQHGAIPGKTQTHELDF